MSASLSAVWDQALFRLPPLQCRCHSRARASLRNRHQGSSIVGFGRADPGKALEFKDRRGRF
jgi:hypothetical protein